MRRAAALLLLALLAGCVDAERPTQAHPTVLQVSRAERPMPGAVDLAPSELEATPALRVLRGALDEAKARGPSASAPVTAGEGREILAFLEARWESAGRAAPPRPMLVRYEGVDFGVSLAAA